MAKHNMCMQHAQSVVLPLNDTPCSTLNPTRSTAWHNEVSALQQWVLNSNTSQISRPAYQLLSHLAVICCMLQLLLATQPPKLKITLSLFQLLLGYLATV